MVADCDELWLFTSGTGEVWVDGQRHDITPNTLVYTPMGSEHRFQMFSPYENVRPQAPALPSVRVLTAAPRAERDHHAAGAAAPPDPHHHRRRRPARANRPRLRRPWRAQRRADR